MSATKDAALAYASTGFPVLQLYGMTKDEDTGVWSCSCPAPGTKSCNPGKHVLFTGHGVKDATLDPAVIETWPEGCNVGVAGQDTYPIIDIDDPAIAQALLDEDVGLRDIATVAITGRLGGGLHFYVQCAPTKNGILKRKDTGERIGEVRASGLYVVAPPSMHPTGRRYTWLGQSIADDITVFQGDGWAYAAEILSWIGVELVPKRDTSGYAAREGFIPIVPDLPFPSTNAMLMSMLHESYVVGDRSSELFKLACELLRERERLNLDTDLHLLAGVLKHADIERGTRHPGGPKYAHRENADDYYWSIVQDGIRAIAEDTNPPDVSDLPPLEVQEGDDRPPAQQADRSYYFVEKPPQFIDNTNPRRPKRICNFEPFILDQSITWEEDEEENIQQKYRWKMRARRGEDVREFTLEHEQYRNGQKFAESVRGVVPTHFVIEDGMAGKFLTGTQHYSGERIERKAAAFTGWLPDMDAFLLPGGAGLITPDGLDPAIRFEPPPTSSVPARFYQYGWGVTPSDFDLSSLLRMLYTVRDPEITVPVLTQTFASALTSLGAGDSSVVVHIFGGTGSFKSTLARLALSVFGRFLHGQSDKVEEWNATTTALSVTMHMTRDLPLVVDDYKISRLPQDPKAVIGLIQNYADRTSRSRSSPGQRNQRLLDPRCLLISTGEDVWEGQESADARTLIVDTTILDQDEKDALKARSTPLLELAKQGVLGSVGYEWLLWLTRRGHSWIRTEIEDRHRKRQASKAFDGSLHDRKRNSLAMLISLSSLIREFIEERAPDFAPEFRDLERTGWTRVLAAEVDRTSLSVGYSPFATLVDTMLASLSIGEAYLQPRLADGIGVGMQGADVIGFIDHEYVWLNEQITLGWYSAKKRREGDYRTPVAWKTLLNEGKHWGGFRPHSAVIVHGQGINPGGIRMFAVPRAKFFADSPAALQEQLENFS